MQTAKYIIVVDDNPSMLRGIGRLLREYGFASRLFETGSALLRDGGFDSAICLILDVNLSDGSGIELRHRLADRGIDIPVIYITGNDNPATRMAAMASGCVAYLTKPFTANLLIQPIERLLAGRRLAVAGPDHSSMA
ncbi:response regulator [Bradyrhizobium sp. Pear76]|uniref:response regulator transcription factor n=1 Tax=Bradyrhizobium oropedii TaxID=1571201 RepID=UPI001E2828E9|nr:response regulator [Bradyrhizobium oropedii]MCC8966654.1 response regulator [Bradyrhizobium oropedii]